MSLRGAGPVRVIGIARDPESQGHITVKKAAPTAAHVSPGHHTAASSTSHDPRFLSVQQGIRP